MFASRFVMSGGLLFAQDIINERMGFFISTPEVRTCGSPRNIFSANMKTGMSPGINGLKPSMA